MNAVFADAGYWIALFNPRDQLHAKAIMVSGTLQDRPIVTSQMVLTEFLNHYAALGQPFRQRAVQVVRSLQDDPDVEQECRLPGTLWSQTCSFPAGDYKTRLRFSQASVRGFEGGL